MRKANEVKRLLRSGQRAHCEIRAIEGGAPGYALWVATDADGNSRGQPLSWEDGSPMRFADPVGARAKATALGFPKHWIRVARRSA